ncbi:hypothetical protein [Pseudotenacibaculum haliotis]|uniref:Uncharacterized protein n=1 Tax=Pseudotenacibaculum haliotis TaxID=1862138 RepID=A0ABW5LUA5_9FLAO
MSKNTIEYISIFSSIISLISGLITINDNNIYLSISLILISLIFILYIFYRNYYNPINFSTLKESIELNIEDEKGELVKYKKNILLKCSKSNAYYFFNSLNEFNGKIKNIKVSNGNIDTITKNNGIYLIMSKLEAPLKRGEILERSIECEFINCFINEKEFWSSTKNYPGTHLEIKICFPINRTPKTFSSYEKIGHIEKLMKSQPNYKIENNKYILTLNVKKVKLFATYYLKWEW